MTLLKDVIKHPALFKAYPELKRTAIFFEEGVVRHAGYSEELKSLTINPATVPIDKLNQVIMHEIQHAIQYKEKFAVGASIKGDPLRLRQVLTNLMGNACKFTKSGEIELSLDIEEESETGIKLHAKIRDTGIGIPEDKLTTIFEPFNQADGSTTRKYGGTGLGLGICKKISELMGGEVWAEKYANSQLKGGDSGSIFHITAWLEKIKEKEAGRVNPWFTVREKGAYC